MYYEHFGLNEPPFKITPDTRLFYTGGNRGAILDAIVYAITSGEGIVKVVGEVGSGKTMLCRMLEVRLPESVEVVYLANPSLSPENILHAIAFEMRLPVDADANRLQVMQALQDRLLGKHADDRQVVVFVEEAQSMPLETLEEIRLLSNLETQRAKLLQIVLFGQPELEPNLSEPHIRQLRERITHSFDLPPFSKPETKEYLDFRMRAAGYRGPEVFSPSAVRAITNASTGLIRRTNILADKSLLAAYAAGVHRITGSQVKVALKDSEFGRSPPRQFSGRALAAGIFLPVLVGGGYLLGSGYWLGRVGGEAAPAPAVAIEAPVLAGEPIQPPPSPISTGERQMARPVPPVPEGQTGVVLRPSEAIINVIEEGDAEPGQQSVTRNQPTVETWVASGGATGMATEQQINLPPGTV
ncbi:MAG: AAA family ATPase, partial [Gammaproteobacteria bacterium]|nr:AAA family ATPase [Gammaproteobacteria bacterium]